MQGLPPSRNAGHSWSSGDSGPAVPGAGGAGPFQLMQRFFLADFGSVGLEVGRDGRWLRQSRVKDLCSITVGEKCLLLSCPTFSPMDMYEAVCSPQADDSLFGTQGRPG